VTVATTQKSQAMMCPPQKLPGWLEPREIKTNLKGEHRRLALQRRRAKHTEAKPSAESGRWAVFPGNPLLHFLDFFFYFFCPIGIELFFIAESPASA
jgi:hypothetical protein